MTTRRLRWARRFRRGDDHGVAAMVVATALVVVLTFVAIALDLGRDYLLKTRLHQAVEMAAEAGAGAYDREALDTDGVQRLDLELAETRAETVLAANLPESAQLDTWDVIVLDDGNGGGGVDPITGNTYDTPTVIVTARASIPPVFTLASLTPAGGRLHVEVTAAASQKFRFEQ
jgi:Flp pilus assembly protein TadG